MDLQIIQSKIHEIRGYRVMLDADIAVLYGVETKALKQAVKRNLMRFPPDFMFELTKEEIDSLRSQNVTLKNNTNEITSQRGKHSKYLPFAFTEQGVAMLSSVLRSDTAVKVNIQIMRAFVLMRQMIAGYEELLKRVEELEQSSDAQFSEIYKALTELLSKSEQEKERRPIGYIQNPSNENK